MEYLKRNECISKHCHHFLYNKNKFHSNYEIVEHILKNLIKKNILPTNPSKKVRLIIYDDKFQTSNLIISNNSSPSNELLDKTNIIYICSNVPWETVSKENNTYVGLTITTLSRWLMMHSSITLHLKTHSIPKSKF